MQSMYKYELEDLLRFVEQQRRIRIIQNFKIDYMKTNYSYKLFLAMMFCLVAVSCRDKITINLSQMTMEEIFEFYGEDYAEYLPPCTEKGLASLPSRQRNPRHREYQK